MATNPWENFPGLSDLEITVGNRKVNCHKIILAYRSPVFQRMFESNMIESLENKLTIEDADVTTVLDFLWHLYEPTSVMDKSKLTTELLKVATKYMVSSLMQIFKENSREIINNDNAIDFAVLLSEFDFNDEFLLQVVEYIISNFPAIKEQPNYHRLLATPKVSGIMIEKLYDKQRTLTRSPTHDSNATDAEQSTHARRPRNSRRYSSNSPTNNTDYSGDDRSDRTSRRRSRSRTYNTDYSSDDDDSDRRRSRSSTYNSGYSDDDDNDTRRSRSPTYNTDYSDDDRRRRRRSRSLTYNTDYSEDDRRRRHRRHEYYYQ